MTVASRREGKNSRANLQSCAPGLVIWAHAILAWASFDMGSVFTPKEQVRVSGLLQLASGLKRKKKKTKLG